MATSTTRRRLAPLGAALFSAALPGGVRAPAAADVVPRLKSMRFVVPYPPGGPTDIMARVVAQALAREQPQIASVENRPGAAGVVGTEAVARAAPDGATLLVNASAHVIVPHMVRVPYDPLVDFAPVTNIAAVPLMLVVTPGLPVRSVAELVAHAKANPGRLSFASSSNGGAPHLAGELFKLMAGVDMAHVPYRGSGQAVPDLIAGNVQVMFDSMPSSAGAVREGKLRALAVTTAGRQAAFPELPTVSEAGVPGYEISTWYGIWAPARTPAPFVGLLQAWVALALRGAEARERMAALGAQPMLDLPAYFADFVRAEHGRWGRLVRDAGIKAD